MPANRIRWLLLALCLLSVSPIAVQAQTATTQAVTEPKDKPAEDTAPPATQEDPRTKPLQRFSGRVIDSDGKPIEGASVAVASGEHAHISQTGHTLKAYAEEKRVLLFFTPKNAKRSGKAETDAEGRFSISNLAYGTYHVAAIHAGHERELIDEIKFTADSSPVEIKLAKAEAVQRYTVAGHVKNTDGLPIDQAFVGIVKMDGGTIIWHRGETALSQGDMWIYNNVDSHTEAYQHDWFSGIEQDSEFQPAARTDAKGAFSIRGVHPGTYHLAAAHKFQGIQLIEQLEITPQMKLLEITLRPDAEQKTQTLDGRVDDKDGKPVGHIAIAIASRDGGDIFAHSRDPFGSTDAEVDLWAHAETPGNKEYRWFTSKGGAANAATGKTNEDGTFSFNNILPGTYHLAAVQSANHMLLVDEVKLDADFKPLKLTLNKREAPETAPFKGRVVDYEGQPVANASVGIAEIEHGRLYWMGASIFEEEHVSALYWNPDDRLDHEWFTFGSPQGRAGMAKTNIKGEFTITNLRPGDYKLLVKHKTAGATLLDKISFKKDGEPIQVTLGKPTFIEGTISGLTPMTETPDIFLTPSIDTPKGIRFSFEIHPDVITKQFRAGPLLNTQDWVLQASEYVSAKGYSAVRLAAPLTVTPGTNAKLNIDLSKGEKVSGQVLGPKGTPLSGVSVVAYTQPKKAASREDDEANEESDEIPSDAWAYGAITDSFGKYTIKGVPKGDYILRAKRHAKRTAPG